ncbi:hypothetical protein [Sphingomonas xinjiangensis]|uniref:Uncharacterized protein n=1 Tax=Sphingomonas xinjiangensis TaxID=643568 RepID=A0A840Y9H4_9SPHN|nr:hypothetical protein [Sphingomonas xinjiangensis]MBB5708945.1 hypothetical protein [Sphingomonas xinjiangensis]
MAMPDGHDVDGQAGKPARERIAEVLRVALESREDAPIDDATRRLMLHLSIEPPSKQVLSPAEKASPDATSRPVAPRSLLRRVLNRSLHALRDQSR